MFYAVLNDRQASLKFEQFPTEIHDRLLDAIRSLTDKLEARVLATEPRGKTGKLSEATVETVFHDNPERIAGYVRITKDFGKAGALEFGSHRQITVNSRSAGLLARQGHTQRSNMMAAFMRAVTTVGAAYTRQTNIAAHHFLRGSIETLGPEAQAELQQAIERAIQS